MDLNKKEPNETNPDAELADLESSATGQALQAAGAQIAPRLEFAQQLEAHLLHVAQPQPSVPAGLKPALTQHMVPWAGRFFGQERVRFALSGFAVGLAVLGVFVTLALFSGARGGKPLSILMSEFVPEGKVRHLVLSDISEASGSVMSYLNDTLVRTLEIWYGNGQNHLLMYLVRSSPNSGSDQIIQVTDDGVYTYRSEINATVSKYPYNPRYTDPYAPQPEILSDWLRWRLPFARTVGSTNLDGRSVELVEGDNTQLPGFSGIHQAKISTKYWIDGETHRVLKQQMVTEDTGIVSTNTVTITIDELKDTNELPASFFTFKPPPGANVVELVDPIAPKIDAAQPIATWPGWVDRSAGQADRASVSAPDFTLTNILTNQPIKLSSLRGEPVVLNFWGTWCAPCLDQMSEMSTLYKAYKDQARFVSISIGPRDEPAGVAQFINQKSYDWIFLDDHDSSVSQLYQLQGIPSTFFIDRDGIIRSTRVGRAYPDSIESSLQQIGVQVPLPEPTAEEPIPRVTPTWSEPTIGPLPIITPVPTSSGPMLPLVPTPASQPPRMPLEEFIKLYSDPITRPLIIDVRAKESYDEGHITGAISFPEADVGTRVSELPRDKLIVAYCQ